MWEQVVELICRCSNALCWFNLGRILSTEKLEWIASNKSGETRRIKQANSSFCLSSRYILIITGQLTELNRDERARGPVTLFTNNAGGGSNVHLQLDDWPVAMTALTSAHARHTSKCKGWLLFFWNVKRSPKGKFQPHASKCWFPYIFCANA